MSSDLPLRGRVAAVTGGSRGIGRAIAIELAAQGADVALSFLENAEEGVVEEVLREVASSLPPSLATEWMAALRSALKAR